jgi:hypothetical protein
MTFRHTTMPNKLVIYFNNSDYTVALLTYLFTYLLIYLLIYLLTYLFTYLLTYLFTYLLTYLLGLWGSVVVKALPY